jgi:threonine dehydrogenase-like Zn-dependent dehydrogenase
VTAVARRPFSLDLARRLGAAAAMTAADAEETGSDAFDVVVEAVGADEPLAVAGRLVRTRGRLVIAGFHQESPSAVDLQAWNWKGIDVVNAHERDDAVRLDGMREGLDLVADGHLDLSPLYTHSFPLEQINDAFTAAVEHPEGFAKALVVMR